MTHGCGRSRQRCYAPLMGVWVILSKICAPWVWNVVCFEHIFHVSHMKYVFENWTNLGTRMHAELVCVRLCNTFPTWWFAVCLFHAYVDSKSWIFISIRRKRVVTSQHRFRNLAHGSGNGSRKNRRKVVAVFAGIRPPRKCKQRISYIRILCERIITFS